MEETDSEWQSCCRVSALALNAVRPALRSPAVTPAARECGAWRSPRNSTPSLSYPFNQPILRTRVVKRGAGNNTVRQRMIDLRKVHEKEAFDLVSPRMLSWKSVQPKMEKLGFTFIDDFAEMMRKDQVHPWQSEAIASCDFLSRGTPVYPDEADFDSIRYSVLIATLPEEQAAAAIHLLFLLSSELSLHVSYAGRQVSRDDSLSLLKSWHAETLAEAGDVSGSESVRILIHMEYEKHRA